MLARGKLPLARTRNCPEFHKRLLYREVRSVISVANKPDAVGLALMGQSPSSAASDEHTQLDWDDIIAGCQQSDRAMQRELYERSREQLFRLAVRMVGRQDAADVCQTIYLKIYQSIDQFAGRASVMTWLYRIAVNECLQHRRSRARKTVLNLADYEPAEVLRPFTDRHSDHDLLETALQRIDPELRCIFLLREKEELSYAEIANVMQLADGTVASRLNRARHQLQEELTALGYGWGSTTGE